MSTVLLVLPVLLVVGVVSLATALAAGLVLAVNGRLDAGEVLAIDLGAGTVSPTTGPGAAIPRGPGTGSGVVAVRSLLEPPPG